MVSGMKILRALAFITALPTGESFSSFGLGGIGTLRLSQHELSDSKWNRAPGRKLTLLFAKKRGKRRKSSEPKPQRSAEGKEPDAPPSMEIESTPLTAMEESDMSLMESVQVGSDQTLMEAMRGSGASLGGVSAKELLRDRDRTLEQSFEFDEVSDPLPRFDRTNGTLEPTLGKKRARAEARKAAAVKAAEEGSGPESIDNFIADLPFVGKKPGEKTTPVKLLESGAWIGIAILVIWEIYLNSPFFERAAPLNPIVY